MAPETSGEPRGAAPDAPDDPAGDTLGEIAAIVADLGGADADAAGAAAARQAQLGASAGADGALAGWLAGWQRRYPVRLERPRIALFAAAHGHDPAATAVTRDRLADAGRETNALYRLCEDLDADLRVYEMALDAPGGDIRRAAALDRVRTGHALAYGMMTVEDGTDIIGLDALNPAARGPAAALGRALLGGADGAWPDLPDMDAWSEGGLPGEADGGGAAPFDLLARFGGDDIAAMTGAIIAARIAGSPVLLGGPGALAAAAVVAALRPDGVDHCAVVSDADPLVAAFAIHLPAARLGGVSSGAGGAGEGGADAGFPGLRAARAVAVLRQTVAAHLTDDQP